MRKFYSFLIVALLMPVLAFAQSNKAISVSQQNPYYCVDNMLEIPYVGLIEDQIPASRDICYSVAFWIKPSATLGTSGQFTTAEGKCMGLLFGFGTSEHTNPGQWQYGLGYSSDGAIQIIGDGGLGATSNGFAPNPAAMVDTLSLDEWSFVVFTVDNVNRKAALYVNGECKHEAELSAPGMYFAGADSREGDDGKWATFQWFSYRAQGSLDEVSFYNKALSASEVTDVMSSAYTNSSLIALYTMDSEKQTVDGQTVAGHFANQAPGGAEHDAVYKTVSYGAYWGGSAMVYRKGSTEKTPSFTEGRTIEIKDVTLEIPETTGGSVTLTEGENTLTTGTHTVKTQTVYTVTATPAEGYALRNLYSEVNGQKLVIANGSMINIVADTKVYGDFTNDFNKLTVNCGEGAEYFMMRNGLHVTDIDNLITGETYTFTVTITDAAKRLVEVNINGEALEAVDGVYSFVSAEGQTLNIVTGDKPYYTITIEQPEVGGTIKVMHGDEEVVSGTTVRESETITLVSTPTDENWVRTNWIVNGEKFTPSTIVVTKALTISAKFLEGVAPCVPQPVDGRAAGNNTSRADRVVKSIVVSDASHSMTIEGTGTDDRPVYNDNRGNNLFETTAGSELKLVTDGVGVWMHTSIWADFDFNGFDTDDAVWIHNDDNHINIAGERTFEVPATLKENIPYNVRYMVDWDCNNPCQFGQASGDNGEYITDFLVMVKQPRIDNFRNVTIATNDAEFGKVEFVNIDAEGNTVNTDYASVYVKATTLNEIATFINWTDAEGNEVSTEPEFAYTGTEDVVLTANFGYPVSYTYNSDLGTVAVTVDGKYIASGAGVPAGKSINIDAQPKAGYMVQSITVDGAAVTENPVTVTVNAPMTIEVVFADAVYTFQTNVEGDGVVRAATEMGDDELPTGTEYKAGDVLTLDEELLIWLIPGEGQSLQDVEVTSGETVLTMNECEVLSNEKDYFTSILVTDNVIVNATFTGTGAIDGIEADDANAPVEFYNLQGVRVNSENLVPGIYVRRQGSKAVKVYVTK